MRRRPLIFALGLVGALMAAGYGALFALLDEFRDIHGIGESALGVVVGSGFIAGFVAQVTIAPLADRGHARRLVVAGLVLNVLGLTTMALATSVTPLLGGRLMTGIGAGIAVPALRRIAILADPLNLGANLGRLVAADVAGFAAGPALAAVLVGPFGLAAPFLVTASAAAVALPFVARLQVAETIEPARERFAFDLLRHHSYASAVALGCGVYLMMGAFDALWSVAVDDLDTAEWISTLGISLFALPLVIFAPVGGRLAQRVGPLWLGTVGLIAGSTFMAAYGLVPTGAAMFGVAMTHALTDGLTVASAGVAVGLVVPADRLAGAQGVLGGLQTLVAGFTAILAGVLYDTAGRATAYLVTALLMVATAALAVRLARQDVGLRGVLAPPAPALAE